VWRGDWCERIEGLSEQIGGLARVIGDRAEAGGMRIGGGVEFGDKRDSAEVTLRDVGRIIGGI
jgi:hypothetical protein